MPRPPKTAEQRAAMRMRIREATSRVIRRLQLAPGDVYGYERITIREVIEEAGISIGTFYKYFENRQDLAQSLWSEPVDKLKSQMQSDYEEAQNPIEKIRTLLQHYVRFSIENQRVFRGAFLFVRPDGQHKPKPIDLENEMFYQNLHAAFIEGQESGIFRDFNPREMAQVFWAAIHGSIALPINLDRFNFDSVDRLSNNMIDALLTLISAR